MTLNAHHKPSRGEGVKTRLSIDLDGSGREVVLTGEGAGPVWGARRRQAAASLLAPASW